MKKIKFTLHTSHSSLIIPFVVGTVIGRRAIPLVSSSVYVQWARCACDTHNITS